MKIIVGMTGATGAIYGITMLRVLQSLGIESHLIISRWAEKTIALECRETVEQIRNLASCCYHEDAQDAPISSGSFKTDGMAVIPCSMKTLAAISHSMNNNLISRAADIVLKERKKLVVVARETPLNMLHLENMLRLTQAGGIVLPPMPAFYNNPKTIQDIVNHTVMRVLDQFSIGCKLTPRWGEDGLL